MAWCRTVASPLITHSAISVYFFIQAISRIVERNGLSEEEAAKRIDSQLSNEDRVSQANVVLSTFWAPEVTQKQVSERYMYLVS